MKLLPSPSISSPSTTTTTTTNSFDVNLCTSKSATASCLTGIFRRLLCSCSLPTHPSDQITSIPCQIIKQQHLVNSNNTLDHVDTAPGIVARLMGLESLPHNTLQVSPSYSISRSRSMNSVEFLDDNNKKQDLHRRVNSALSFHEMPSFLELENEEFFVLSFEKTSESKKIRSKQRKHEVGFGELREKRREKCKSKENDKVKVPLKNKIKKKEDFPNQDIGKIKDLENATVSLNESCENTNADSAFQETKKSNWLDGKEVPDEAKLTRKKKKKNRCALKNEEHEECSSEELSPVSVLDFDQLFVVDPEVLTSDEDTISRRKLSSRLDDYVQLTAHFDNNIIEDDTNSKKTEEKCCGVRKIVCHTQHYINIWGEICRLAETEVVKSNWTCKDVEEISADFGLQILDQLLVELVVDQLTCQENFESIR